MQKQDVHLKYRYEKVTIKKMEEMEQGVIAQDYTKRLKRNVKMGEWNDNILFLGGFILAGAAAIGGVITYLISKIRWASLNYQLDMEYGKRNLSKHAKKR